MEYGRRLGMEMRSEGTGQGGDSVGIFFWLVLFGVT